MVADADPQGSGPVLDLVEARRSFGDRAALDGVSLRVGPGEIYGLLGPNGAGKTTLIRSVCGRLALDAGTVRVLGEPPIRGGAARRAIGLVPQGIALYGELSVRENLEILGRLAGLAGSRTATAVRDALDWTGLGERENERVAMLSGGMQRRLNLAAGTLHDPRLLLLDEPTVGIDPQAREAIHELLLGLRARGMAILLTTHDLEQAEALADRVGLMIDGRLRAEGTVPELIGSTFGTAKEIQVLLSVDPDAADAELLSSEGLRVSTDPMVWSGPLRGGLDDLAGLGQRLAAAGLGVEEFRLREPGLRGVFLQLTGREIDA